ncbi:MAG: hypothetical protein GAK30_02234 [Paracidovorax wautersii]|uniref:Uncharacterized protein n=1 Tax=Paracidovorax wautersii TaxID=1177982 RepID=A0A7V8FNC7_9BURK|nr:MAG: hypothetical protein GAK30_02234 [Paracidovorax wautersii]
MPVWWRMWTAPHPNECRAPKNLFTIFSWGAHGFKTRAIKAQAAGDAGGLVKVCNAERTRFGAVPFGLPRQGSL